MAKNNILDDKINVVTHNSASATDSVVAWAKSRAESGGGTFATSWDSRMPLDICKLKIRSGTLTGFMARTNEGKTYVHSSLWPKWVKMIEERNATGKHNGRLVIVSVEESLEETWVKFLNYMGLNVSAETIDSGKVVDIDGFTARISQYSSLPVIIIGPTLVPEYNNLPDDSHLASKMPVYIVNNLIVESIKRMGDVGGVPATADIICFGNIQNMTAGNERTTDDMGIVAAKLRGLAQKLNAAVTVEIQAKEASVRHPIDPLPKALDTEWSSQIAQAVETMISICRVANWDMIEVGDEYWGHEINAVTFVLGVTKQRLSGGLVHRRFIAREVNGAFTLFEEIFKPKKAKKEKKDDGSYF